MKLSTVQGRGCGPVWGLPGPWPPTGFPWQCCRQSETGISQRRVEVFLENFPFASHFPYALSSQLSVSKDRVSCYRPLKFSFRWKKGFFRIARFWNNLNFLLERGNFKSRGSRDLIQLCMLTPPRNDHSVLPSSSAFHLTHGFFGRTTSSHFLLPLCHTPGPRISCPS